MSERRLLYFTATDNQVYLWRAGNLEFEAILIFDQVPDPVRIIAAVGENRCSPGQIVEQDFGHRSVVHLTRREFDLHRKTVADDAQMQLRRQSSTASADTSISSFFSSAAAC